MHKRLKFIEELLPPVIATTVLLISFADFFGFFSLIPSSRIPLLSLLLMSLVLSSLVLIFHRVSEMHEQIQILLLKNALEHMGSEFLEQVDPSLRKILKDEYFLAVITFLLVAIKEKKVAVDDNVRLSHYHIRTLEAHPKGTFLSTLPSTATQFENHQMEKAIANFIQKGGKMKHIFFVKDAQELSLPKLQEKAARLKQLGVQVHFVNSSSLTGDLRKNVLVESRGKISWEMHVDQEGHSVSGTLTANKQVNGSYCNNFEKLLLNEIHTFP